MVDRYNNGRGIGRSFSNGCAGGLSNTRRQCGCNDGCARNLSNTREQCGCNDGCAESLSNTRRQCGCNDGCDTLLQKLQKIDFSIIDVILYLDAYPCNSEAMKYYHALREERAEIIEKLAKNCDMPITNFDNTNADKWVWTDTPWPWEICAN